MIGPLEYFIITSGEDGTGVEHVSEITLLARITPNAAGETYYGTPLNFITSVPEFDKGVWMLSEMPGGRNILIIKGKIALPRITYSVVKYEM